MSKNFGNILLGGSRQEPGQIILPPNGRKSLGMWQIPGNNLGANIHSAINMYDDTNASSIWQYSPLVAPVSIAAFQVYFVAAVNTAGTVYFQLQKNGGEYISQSIFLNTSTPLQTLTFDRGAITSHSVGDYWWLMFSTTSDWNGGGSLISYTVWIYDGIA